MTMTNKTKTSLCADRKRVNLELLGRLIGADLGLAALMVVVVAVAAAAVRLVLRLGWPQQQCA